MKSNPRKVAALLLSAATLLGGGILPATTAWADETGQVQTTDAAGDEGTASQSDAGTTDDATAQSDDAAGDDTAVAESATVTASDYAELKNAIDAVGFYQSGVITITGNIVFDGQITLTQGKKITLVSDADKCGTACRLGYATRSRYSLFNIVEDSSLTIGGGTDETDRFSFVDEKDGRLAQVGSYAGGKGTVTINGGTYSNNGSARNTTGDGNVAFVFANGNLTINGGTFSNNLAFPAAGALPTIGVSRSGGAVVRSSGTVTVNGGTFDGNTAGANTANNRTFHGGGAIWSDGTLTINGGTFSDNVSNAQRVMSGAGV